MPAGPAGTWAHGPAAPTAAAPPAPCRGPTPRGLPLGLHRRHPVALRPRQAGRGDLGLYTTRHVGDRLLSRGRTAESRQDSAPHSGKRCRPGQKEALLVMAPQPENAPGATRVGDRRPQGARPPLPCREGAGSWQGVPLSLSPEQTGLHSS